MLARTEKESKNPSEKDLGGAQQQRTSVNTMGAVAATFLAEQISWPEEKNKH